MMETWSSFPYNKPWGKTGQKCKVHVKKEPRRPISWVTDINQHWPYWLSFFNKDLWRNTQKKSPEEGDGAMG